MTLEGHFLPCEQGNIFITQFSVMLGDTAILCLPPLFEELNLSRAVIAKQAQRFSAHNLPCFVMDYFGTGDSEGELEQANIDIWLQNIVTTSKWLEQRGVKNIIIWGVRFGSLLVLAYQQLIVGQLPITYQLHWKPILNGRQYLAQFLRIKQTKDMLQSQHISFSGENSSKENWRERILLGETIEVAGYKVSTDLFVQVEQLSVNQKLQTLSPILWCELASNKPSPVLEKLLLGIDSSQISLHCVPSQSFWQTPEVFDVPELVSTTCTLLTSQLNASQ
jgi:exosortase A-associated hydrolase 2